MKSWNCITAIALAVAGLGLQQTKADTIYDLSVPNTAISGFPGPYGTVDVSLTSSTTATITFTSDVNSGNIYLFGGVNSVDVNVNATSWTISGITGSNSGTGFTPGPFSDGGSGNVDGFGILNQTVTDFDGFTHSADVVSFTLTNTSGTWASDAAVLIANSNGVLAAAHIFVTAFPADASNGAIATGFAANGGARVPDGGATVALLGIALGALEGVRRLLRARKG